MMTKLFLRFPILNCLAIASFFGCANTYPTSMPKNYSIILSEQAGMLHNETKIILSNTAGCSIEFNTSGIKNTINFTPEKEELASLIQFMKNQISLK